MSGTNFYEVLPLRIGVACCPPLSIEDHQFYTSVGEFLRLGRMTPSSMSYVTSCLISAEVEANPEIVATTMEAAARGLEKNFDVLFVDFTSPHLSGGDPLSDLPFAADFQIATGLVRILQMFDDETKVVALVPRVFTHDEAARVPVEPYIIPGRLILLGEDGECTHESLLNPSTYKSDLQKRRGPLRDQFKAKIVEHRGWFVPHNDQNRYSRIYFDCSYAQRELTYLLAEKISSNRRKLPEAILFSTQNSAWLKEPVLGAARRLGINHVYDLDDAPDLARAERLSKRRSTTLVMSYVDSGATIAQIRGRFEESRQFHIVDILSVFSTVGIEPGATRPFDLRIEGKAERFDVQFIAGCQQQYVARGDDRCLVENFDCEITVIPHFRAGPLDAYEFWDLVLDGEIGATDESTPPGHRSEFVPVPDLEKMVLKYGKWLAHRLWTMVQDDMGASAASHIFVHPRGEPISTGLAEAMRELLSVRTVSIPRETIQEVALTLASGQPGAEVNELVDLSWESDDDWSRTLAGASKAARIFILDDFRGSGVTESGLRQILTSPSANIGGNGAFDVRAACYLMDFGSQEERDGNKRVSLYGWPRESTSTKLN